VAGLGTTTARPAGAAGTATAARADGAPAAVLAAAEEKLLACVHCGFCLPACPTYTRLGDEADSPRGRIYLMRAVAEGRLDPADPAFTTHIDRCLGCRACETACPAGVEYGHLLERARAAARAAAGRRAPGAGLAARALLGVFRRPATTRLALAAARALRATGLPATLATRLPDRFARARLALAMLAATAPDRLARAARSGGPAAGPTPVGHTTGPGPAPRPAPDAPRRAALLRGCVQDGLFRHVNRATARVLERNGVALAAAPGQRCCGALHAHAGDLEAARALARANIEAFERADADVVVVNAAGCGAAMKEYGELLADDPAYADRARALAARVRDACELLDALGPAPGAPLPIRVAYDAPCHLHHAQRITAAPLRMLAAVPGLEASPLPGADECCGGAGIYGLLHPELGGRILSSKVEAIRAAGPDAVVTPNPGCILQIGAGLRLAGLAVPVLHPIELLAESYRRLEPSRPAATPGHRPEDTHAR